MKRKASGFLLTAAGLALFASPASGHHGVTNYDMNKVIVLNGTITGFDWSNPHCLAYIDVMGDSGNVRHWTIELSSTLTMSHRGWEKDTLKRGDHVTVETHPAKNDVPVGITVGPAFALRVFVNGKEIPPR